MAFAFFLESTLLPVAALLPQIARAETPAHAVAYTAVFNDAGTSGGALAQNSWGVTHGTLIISNGTVHNAVVMLTLPNGFYSPSVVSFTVNGVAQPLANLPPMSQSGNTYSWSFGDIAPQTAFLAVKFLTNTSAQAGTIQWSLAGSNIDLTSVFQVQQSVSVAGGRGTEPVAQVTTSIDVLGPDGTPTTTFTPSSTGVAGYTTGTLSVTGGTVHNALVKLTLPTGFTSLGIDSFTVNGVAQPLAYLPQTQQNGSTYSWNFGDIAPQIATLKVKIQTTAGAQSGNITWELDGTNMPSSSMFQIRGVGVVQTLVPPTVTLSPSTFPQGAPLTGTVTNGTPGQAVFVTCIDPNGAKCADNLASGVIGQDGTLKISYDTAGWLPGMYQVWVVVGGLKSNVAAFIVTQAPPPAPKSGTITASSNPCSVPDANQSCTITLTWNSAGITNGVVTLQTAGLSNTPESDWAYNTNGASTFSMVKYGTVYTFSLYDFSGGIRGALLAKVAITAQLNPAGVTIFRNSAPAPLYLFKAGDATTLTATAPLSLFTTNQPVQIYRQVGSNAPSVTDTTDITTLKQSGACNPNTGICSLGGQWSASQLTCPAPIPVSKTQTMTEWVVVGNTASNKINWNFQCSNAPANLPQLSISANSFVLGSTISGSLTNAAPSSPVTLSCVFNPNGNRTTCASAFSAIGSTDSSGNFAMTVPSAVLGPGDYQVWVSVNNITSNTVYFSIVSPNQTQPVISLSATSIPQGVPFAGTVTNAPANQTVYVTCVDPNGMKCADNLASGATNASGVLTVPYSTTGWTPGNYQSWVVVGGVKSNVVTFAIIAPTQNAPNINLTSASLRVGTPFIAVLANSAPNAQVYLTCILNPGPNQVSCIDASLPAGVTDSNGQITFNYDTSGWTPGNYQGWATVNGAKSNVVNFVITSMTGGTMPPPTPGPTQTPPPSQTPPTPAPSPTPPPTQTPPPSNAPTPTPDTAPMATLTLDRDQDQAQLGQSFSFTARLDSTKVSFPSDSLLWVTTPPQATLTGIALDGRALASGADYVLDRGNYKLQMGQLGMLSGVHSLRITLTTNSVGLDSLAVLKANITDGGLTKLLVREQTTSVSVMHLPTEVIGSTTKVTIDTTSYNTAVISALAKDAPQPRLGDTPSLVQFFMNPPAARPTTVLGTVNVPATPPPPVIESNIAYTLFGDTKPVLVNQFSEPLAREFILANYNFLLGRNPSESEISAYLPLFTNWHDPFDALIKVYDRRTDLQNALSYRSGGAYQRSNNVNLNTCESVTDCVGNPNSALYDWVRRFGVNEESTLAAFKENVTQTQVDALRPVWNAYMQSLTTAYNSRVTCSVCSSPPPPPPPCPVSSLVYPYTNRDFFDTCRTMAILWAKDKGWADPTYGSQLASLFAPGNYPDYQTDRGFRYPPATLYYEMVSSPEYRQFLPSRFKKNIDSLYRVIRARPANDSDINEQYQFMRAVQKLTTVSIQADSSCIFGGGGSACGGTRDISGSWIRENWEPNPVMTGGDESGSKHVVYGIRNIRAEIDSIAGRLIDRIGDSPEMKTGANFKRILTGLYRLYLRRTPTQSEIDTWQNRINTDNAKYHLKVAEGIMNDSYQDLYGFEGIEIALNQSAEYGSAMATSGAHNNVWRMYIGTDADGSAWGTLSNEISGVGNASERGLYAEKHPERQFVFPPKKFEPKPCNFACVMRSISGIIGKLVTLVVGTVLALYGYPGLVMIVEKVVIEIAGETIAHVTILTLGTNLTYGGLASTVLASGIGTAASIALNRPAGSFYVGGSVTKALAGLTYGLFNQDDFLTALGQDENVFKALQQSVAYTDTSSEFAVRPQSPPTPAALAFLARALPQFLGFGKPAYNALAALGDVQYHYQSPARMPNTATTVAIQQFTRALDVGMSGDEIRQLQVILGVLYPSFLPSYQTGTFGPKTRAAVKKLQKRYGLPQTGVVGPQTRAILNNLAR